MKKKTLFCILVCAALLPAALTVLSHLAPAFVSSALAFPLEPVGKGLAALASLGAAGRGLAAALWAGLSLLPLLLLLRREKGSVSKGEAVSLAAWIAAALFCIRGAVAPGSFGAVGGAQTVCAALNVTLLSFAVLWAGVRFTSAAEETGEKKLVSLLKAALALLAAVFTAEGVLSAAGSLPLPEAAPDAAVAVLRALSSLLPCVFGVLVVLSAFDLTSALSTDDRATASKAVRGLTLRAKAGLLSSLAAAALVNLVQVLLLGRLQNVSVTANLPLEGAVFFVVVLALTRLVEANRRLRDDNDLFI